MRFKMGFLIGLAAGYVLGARAGRARYLQIKERWEEVITSLSRRRAVEPAKEAVEPLVRPVEETTGRSIEDQERDRGLSADLVKERLARTGTVGGPAFDVHVPQEIVKERM